MRQQSWRSFWAFALPDEIITALTQIQGNLRTVSPAWKWVKPQNMHLTLHFLGDKTAQELARIIKAFRETCQAQMPLQLSLGHLGAFPSWSNPRVLWVSLEGQVAELAQLARKTAQDLKRLGFDVDDRLYKPHITLARSGDNKEAGIDIQHLRNCKLPAVSPFYLDSLTLYTSQLTPQGPIYTVREVIPFNNN